jgi:hypothetical protein
MEDNPMKLIKCFVIFPLCLLMGTCVLEGDLEIDIGDYEYQLEAWNSQNMLDYQMRVKFEGGASNRKENVVINVRNGIPESSNPPEWIATEWRISTVPEFYSSIKRVEEDYRDGHKKNNDSYSLKVRYNPDYHYPCEIEYSHSANTEAKGAWSRVTWTITVTPLGDLEIDIGDYEVQLEAWNSQDMLDYQLDVEYSYLDILEESASITVRNRVPQSYPPGWGETTVPAFYSSIKEEEKRMRNGHKNGNLSYSLKVSYDTDYHYPNEIIVSYGSLLNSYPSTSWTTQSWTITLTPPEENKQETGNGEE